MIASFCKSKNTHKSFWKHLLAISFKDDWMQFSLERNTELILDILGAYFGSEYRIAIAF